MNSREPMEDNNTFKPKKLKRLDNPQNTEHHGRYSAETGEYRGRYEAEPPQYRGRYEAEPKEETEIYSAEPVRPYQGRYASDVDNSYRTDSVTENADFYRAQHDASSLKPAVELEPPCPPDYDDMPDSSEIMADRIAAVQRRRAENDTEHRRRKSGNKKGKNKGSAKDVLISVGSVVVSLVIIGALLLNMPILWFKKTGQPDRRVSVIRYFKEWQPTVEIEGELHENTMDLKIKSEVLESEINDGLDLPQLVEGQYSVLFIGFDESEQLTDVMWICEFDIGNGELNILQIPRDLAVPDYTNSVTCKFNSIYMEGDYYIDPPIQRVVNAVQENFGIPIDAYVTTTCFDIADMVDLVGGIPMEVEQEIMYEADKIIPAGKVTLSGEQAEWFVRFRHDWAEGDIGRMKNQRKFMAAGMQKLLSIVSDEGRLKLYGYLKEIYKHKWIATDMSVEDLSKLCDFASTLSMDRVRVNMVPGEGAKYPAQDGMTYDIYSVHKYATVTMLNKFYRPYQDPLTLNDTTLIEYITDYTSRDYDDTGMTLSEVEDADEPMRNEDLKR